MKCLWLIPLLVVCAVAQSPQEISVHHQLISAIEAPYVIDNWYSNSGNTLEVRIKGEFDCRWMPSVFYVDAQLKGRCHKEGKISEAIYAHDALLLGENYAQVIFEEVGNWLMYDVEFEEFGTPVLEAGD
jgi:hypothetical protein